MKASLVLGLALCVGLAACSRTPLAQREPATPLPTATSPIAIVGTLVCLPPRPPEVTRAADCTLGLEDETFRYFQLRDADPAQRNLASIPRDTRIAVAGTYTPGQDARYLMVGVIDIASITRVQPG